MSEREMREGEGRGKRKREVSVEEEDGKKRKIHDVALETKNVSTENVKKIGCPHVAIFETTIYPGRILDVKKAPHAPYRRRRFEKKTALHWGQRKLLMSEIEFLTEYANLSLPVLYVGAAPGIHINVLVRLFPDVRFILVDPREFKVRKSSTVEIRREVFCDESARGIVKDFGRVNFISDIRSVDWKTHDEESLEMHVWQDMIDQQRWHTILSPYASMLKFRLPWNKRQSDYLKGVILFPIWSAPTSTECRLVVPSSSSSSSKETYDNVKYCNQMFYFQTRTRVSMYGDAHRCYDCVSERKILRRYMEKFGGVVSAQKTEMCVSELSTYISESLSTSSFRSIKDAAIVPKIDGSGKEMKTGDVSKLSWDS